MTITFSYEFSGSFAESAKAAQDAERERREAGKPTPRPK